MSAIPDLVIALIDVGAFAGFLFALLAARRNYRETAAISVTWLSYAIGMSFAAAFVLFNALEWLGFYAAILDEVQIPLLATAAAGLVGFALISYAEVVKPG